MVLAAAAFCLPYHALFPPVMPLHQAVQPAMRPAKYAPTMDSVNGKLQYLSSYNLVHVSYSVRVMRKVAKSFST